MVRRTIVARPSVGGVISLAAADALAAGLLGDLRTALGDPHIDHARRVAEGAWSAGDERVVAAALLHDVLEKTGLGADELLALTGDVAVVELVVTLSHRPGESYATYLARCASDPHALLLKRLDLADKLSADGSDLAAADAARIRRRARRRLTQLDALARTLQAAEHPIHPPAGGAPPPKIAGS